MPFVEIHHLTGLNSFSISAEITPHPLQTAPCGFPRFFRSSNPKHFFYNREKSILKWFNYFLPCQWTVPTNTSTTFIMELKILSSSNGLVVSCFIFLKECFLTGTSPPQTLPLNLLLSQLAELPQRCTKNKKSVHTCPSTGLESSLFPEKTSQTGKWATVLQRGGELTGRDCSGKFRTQSSQSLKICDSEKISVTSLHILFFIYICVCLYEFISLATLTTDLKPKVFHWSI